MDECVEALYKRLAEVSSRLDKTSTQATCNEDNILSLFRMKSESNLALKAVIDDGARRRGEWFDLLQLRNVHRKESCEETCLRSVYPAPFSRHQNG